MEENLLKNLSLIKEKEPEVHQALEMVVAHIAKTYSDKYEVKEDTMIDTKKMLYHPTAGKFINVYQVNRYLQRVLSEGYMKSDLINDVLKAIHYLIFDIVRRIKIDEIDNREFKV